MAERNYGQIKGGLAPFINSAAKYLVCGELRRRGIRAEPGPMNAGTIELPGVLGVTLRVKARMNADTWVWNIVTGGGLFSRRTSQDFSILVDLTGGKPVEYFVVPTSELDKKLTARYDEWRKENPKHRENKMRRLDGSGWGEWLAPYRDAWSRLLAVLGGTGGGAP